MSTIGRDEQTPMISPGPMSPSTLAAISDE